MNPNDRTTGRHDAHDEIAASRIRNYRTYFEGWSNVTELDARGRPRTRKVYTGVYHKAALPDSQIRLIRGVYALLGLAAAGLFVLAATRPAAGNDAVVVSVAEAVSLGALTLLGWSLFNYLLSGLQMTLGEYRYAGSVRRASLVCAVCLELTAVSTLIYHIGHADGSYLCAALFLLAGLACAAIHRIEARMVYDVIPSEHTPAASEQE